MTKEQRLYAYLKKFGFVSSKDISDGIGTTTPSKVVSNLRRTLAVGGQEKLIDRWSKGKNRFGEEVRFKQYAIVRGE